jgi:hypothetical protein
MKRKRRGNFGASAAKHGEMAERFAHEAVGKAGDAVRLAEQGSCAAALDKLLDARSSNDLARFNSSWAKRVAARGEAVLAVGRAEDHFKKNCVR